MIGNYITTVSVTDLNGNQLGAVPLTQSIPLKSSHRRLLTENTNYSFTCLWVDSEENFNSSGCLYLGLDSFNRAQCSCSTIYGVVVVLTENA